MNIGHILVRLFLHLVNMEVGQVWNEIVTHQEAHQHPVIYYPLQIIGKWKFILMINDDRHTVIQSEICYLDDREFHVNILS